MKNLMIVFLLFCFAKLNAQKFEGLAPTPPMGWNSWNTFQTHIDENLVKATADLFISDGLKDAGYTYIVLDDGWMTMQRDKDGNLVPDPQKFPHGMKALAAYVHSKGLKFGLYNCAGTKTCAGYPGTKGYEEQDARNYAAWDVDYLKFDWCNTQGQDAKESYTKMSEALKKAGRPIIFSLCEWGSHKPWEWAAPVGQLWRTTGDIGIVFDSIKKFGGWTPMSAMYIVDKEADIRQYAGPGHWNDPDMLEVGNGMTASEDRAHFSMWCMLAAPLMMGNDLRKMTPETKATLTNKDVIALDQDKLGIQAFRYSKTGKTEVWFKPLSGGDWAVCFLNRDNVAHKMSFDWKAENVADDLSNRTLDAAKNTYKIKDLWSKAKLGSTAKTTEVDVPAHDVVVLRLSK
ncbi:MAG TPA: glycoside hydrolase family 27 protein [Chitinophagaceae bacterium]|nr:glycoside hydrolase family 27 protein [Chitinophagaceae bacterium]